MNYVQRRLRTDQPAWYRPLLP